MKSGSFTILPFGLSLAAPIPRSLRPSQLCVQFDFTREARVMDTIALHLAPVADRIQASSNRRGGGRE